MTKTTATPTIQIVDRYLTAYGESDPAERRRLITEAFTEDATLADPPDALSARGHDGLDQLFVGVQRQFPGHSFRRTSNVDEHHGAVRYAWELVGPDGSVAVAGMDVGVLAEDGRLRSVTGFFGSPEPLA